LKISEQTIERVIPIVFWVGLSAYILAFLSLPPAIRDNQLIDGFITLALRAIAGIWVFADSVKYNLSSKSRVLYGYFTVLLLEIVVPLYLIKTRGWKDGFKALAKLITIIIGVLLFDAVIMTVVTYPEWSS